MGVKNYRGRALGIGWGALLPLSEMINERWDGMGMKRSEKGGSKMTRQEQA